MTEETLTTVKVIAPKDRYRRVGFGFNKGENQIDVTDVQLAALQADARLKIKIVSESAAEIEPSQIETEPKAEPEKVDKPETEAPELTLDSTETEQEVAPWVAIIHEAMQDGSLKLTASGVPDIKALEATVDEPAGVKLTADIRDAAWAEYQRLTNESND